MPLEAIFVFLVVFLEEHGARIAASCPLIVFADEQKER